MEFTNALDETRTQSSEQCGATLKMSRKTGSSKRLQFYDRGNVSCPICLNPFTRVQASAGRVVTLEHVPPKSFGGKARCLTCKQCNSGTGRNIDQAAALANQERVHVTVDIMGKRDTFALSLEGKELTAPFAGYSKQDIDILRYSRSGKFTMSVKVPNRKAVAASSLKSAYLALFSLLGPLVGYNYVRGNALAPIRQLIADSLSHGPIRKYVSKAPDELPDRDILLVSQPVLCWIVKVGSQLVTLPLGGDSPTTAPLWDLHSRTGTDMVPVVGHASWKFQTFGALHAVHVHLAGADKIDSLVGLTVSGKLPHGQILEGTCIMHTGESAILLCTTAPACRPFARGPSASAHAGVRRLAARILNF